MDDTYRTVFLPSKWTGNKSRQMTDKYEDSEADCILKCNYGRKVYTSPRSGQIVNKPLTCYMRKAVFDACQNGTFRILPSDNEAGFIVVDTATLLRTPMKNIDGITIY